MRYPFLRYISNAITFARIAALPVLIRMSFVDARQPFAFLTDFSSILPGHGGMVDRFSSFVVGSVLVAPWLLFNFSGA